MDKHEQLGPWIRRFLLEHLIKDRNLSPNTQRSYRDTLAMLLPFIAAQVNKPLDRLEVAGMLANNLQAAAVGVLPIILNLGLKMDPRLVGLLQTIPRLFDAFIDPVIGHISDNTPSGGAAAARSSSGVPFCPASYLP